MISKFSMNRVILLLITFFSVIGFASCNLKVPIKEMSRAKEAGTLAESVQAYDHAPQEFQAGEGSLISSHEYCKLGNLESAKSSAQSSEQYFLEAYNKTVKKLSDLSLAQAKQELEKAIGYGAEYLAPVELKAAQDWLAQAEGSKNGNQLWNANLQAQESIKNSIEAQNKSLAAMPALKEKSALLLQKLEDLKKFQLYSTVEVQCNAAADLLNGANVKIDNKEAQAAAKDMAQAESMVNAAEIALCKNTLNEAKKTISSAEKAMAASYAAKDYNDAKVKYADAQKLYTQKNYPVSTQKAEEVIIIAKKAEAEGMKQAPALLQKIQALKDAWKEMKMQDGDKFAKAELATMEKALKTAEMSLQKGEFQTCLKNIEIAEKALEQAKQKNKEYLVLKKIEKAEEGHAALNDEYAQGKFATELAEIAALINDAKLSFKNKNLETADAQAEEALAKIDALKIAIAKQKEFDKLEDEAALKDFQDKMKKEADSKDKIKGETYTSDGYTVKSGDCLWKIAVKYYGKSNMWPLIYTANKDKIKDPDLIFPGQKLVIPPAGSKIKK